MSNTVLQVGDQRQTDGVWRHTGKLIIQFKQPNGSVITVTLPDDLIALQARPTIDAIEDLKYGN